MYTHGYCIAPLEPLCTHFCCADKNTLHRFPCPLASLWEMLTGTQIEKTNSVDCQFYFATVGLKFESGCILLPRHCLLLSMVIYFGFLLSLLLKPRSGNLPPTHVDIEMLHSPLLALHLSRVLSMLLDGSVFCCQYCNQPEIL